MIIKRQREIDELVSLLENVRQGSARVTVREFFGIPGIGKTELAKQIEKEFSNNGVSCAYLDFDLSRNIQAELYYEQPEELFRILLGDWNELNSPKLRTSLTNLERSTTADRLPAVHRVANLMVKRARDLKPEETIVLLCDETDRIQWERFTWFKEHLVVPLALCGRCFIVWIGRRKQYWEDKRVELKVKSEPDLREFSIDRVHEHLQVSQLSPADVPSDWVTSITCGHPMAGEAAIAYLKKHQPVEPSEIEEELVKEIGRGVIFGYVLRDTSHRIESDDWLLLSIPRAYDPHLLRILFDKPDNSRSLAYYARLLRNVTSTQLTEVSPKHKLHRLAKPLRCLLLGYYRISKRADYLRRQRLVYQEYKHRLVRLDEVDDWSTWALEMLYHLACFNQVAEKRDLNDELENVLRELEESPATIGEQRRVVTRLRESLLTDKEIEEMIGIVVIERLASFLETYLSSLYGRNNEN